MDLDSQIFIEIYKYAVIVFLVVAVIAASRFHYLWITDFESTREEYLLPLGFEILYFSYEASILIFITWYIFSDKHLNPRPEQNPLLLGYISLPLVIFFNISWYVPVVLFVTVFYFTIARRGKSHSHGGDIPIAVMPLFFFALLKASGIEVESSTILLIVLISVVSAFIFKHHSNKTLNF